MESSIITMRNLLGAGLTVDQIEDILKETPVRPLLPPRGDSVWAAVARKPLVRAEWPRLKELAETELDKPLPALTDDLYSEFQESGERLRFEPPYFERRRRLAHAGLCALLDPDERWVHSLTGKLRDIMDEESWAVPAHVANPSGKDPLRIDLFAAETANLMGELLTLFGEVLPVDLQVAIRQRLRRDIFDNFLDRHEAHEWARVGMNWNAVCHQGVLGAALAVEQDHGRLARMLMHAAHDLPTYLGGFAEDGGTSEGPAYWGYGFGWFSVLNEQLETRTGGALSLFEGDPLVRKIALFGPQLALSNGRVVNFSDGSAYGLLRPSLCSYLGERLNEDLCRRTAQEAYRRIAETGLDWQVARRDLFELVRLFLHAPDGAAPPKRLSLEDSWLPSLGVVVARARDDAGHLWEFAAKAGSNYEHHNHNDCGSYLLNVDGERCLVEIGTPEYTRSYFGPQRYEFLAARSLGHSVPLINGQEQFEGESARAQVIAESHSPEGVHLEMELARCYPAPAGCQSCRRTFRLEKRAGRLTVEDRFDLDVEGPVETAVMTCGSATITEAGVLLKCGAIQLLIAPNEGTAADEIQVLSYRTHQGVPTAVQRIVFRPRANARHVRLGYEVTLA
jgi:hypothetical protein